MGLPCMVAAQLDIAQDLDIFIYQESGGHPYWVQVQEVGVARVAGPAELKCIAADPVHSSTQCKSQKKTVLSAILTLDHLTKN
jgi:hypothetical protein